VEDIARNTNYSPRISRAHSGLDGVAVGATSLLATFIFISRPGVPHIVYPDGLKEIMILNTFSLAHRPSLNPSSKVITSKHPSDRMFRYSEGISDIR